MNFSILETPSYADAVSAHRLYGTMMWMLWNFCLLTFLFRPLRVIQSVAKAVTTGTEDPRYVKWFVDRFYRRCRWRELAQTVHR